MSTTNEIYLRIGGQLERLDLDDETQLLPTFQANDRTKPESIQADYSPEFSVPATARNNRLLQHAVNAQRPNGAAYARVPAVLVSDGVETLPLATLLTKGYSEGRYQLQVTGGNRRLVDAFKRPDGSEKTLADLDFSALNHAWTPTNIAARLSYAYWRDNGYGYGLYDRGKPLDVQAVNPFSLYPDVAFSLVWNQLLEQAGFTADDLTGEPLFAQLNIAAANPYVFSADFRDARHLLAGFEHTGNWLRTGEFSETAPFNYVAERPFEAGAEVVLSAAPYRYTIQTLGYYTLSVSLPAFYGCNELAPGEVSMKVAVRVNGNVIAADEHRTGRYEERTFTATAERHLCYPGDVVDALVQGDEWPDDIFGGPDSSQWVVGTRRVGIGAQPFSGVEPGCRFEVQLLEEFPEGGLVKLNEWLPQTTQLEFFKAGCLLLGITCQADPYRPHLHLSTGNKLLENIPRALDWSAKLDRAAQLGRQPERSLSYRLGDYGQTNVLEWKEDESVTKGYGNGQILVADELLPVRYVMATLPFAATEASPTVPGLLRILNFKRGDITVTPPTYSPIEGQPRLTLRSPDREISGQIVIEPEHQDGNGNTAPAVLVSFGTTASYFDSTELSLMLNKNVLSSYWSDLKSLLQDSRYLVERFRLTAADVATLDFSVPVWVDAFQDFFCISKIEEFDARRSTTVHLIRLNSAHLPPPVIPGTGAEFWSGEFWPGEWW